MQNTLAITTAPRCLMFKNIGPRKDVFLEIEVQGAKQVKEKCLMGSLFFLPHLI